MYKILIYLLPFIIFAQKHGQDTILLDNVNIKPKELKLKTITFGRGIGGRTPFYFDYPEAAFLLEDIPYGELTQLTMYFSSTTDFRKREWPASVVQATEYSVTLHKITEDGKLGAALTAPYLVSFQKSRRERFKKVFDLSGLHFYTNRFFVVIKRLSDIPCTECAMYTPEGYPVNKNLYFVGDIKNLKVSEGKQPERPAKDYFGTVLRCQIKTRTREY